MNLEDIGQGGGPAVVEVGGGPGNAPEGWGIESTVAANAVVEADVAGGGDRIERGGVAVLAATCPEDGLATHGGGVVGRAPRGRRGQRFEVGDQVFDQAGVGLGPAQAGLERLMDLVGQPVEISRPGEWPCG